MNSTSILILIPLTLLSIIGIGGCQQPTSQEPHTVDVQIGSKIFKLEIANNKQTRSMGLMYRNSLPADRGMLFVFFNEEVRGFWMKDVPFPLDILFLDSAGKVVTIRQMKPFDLNSTSSIYPAQYAIELNEGSAQTAGVKVGDLIPLPADCMH